MVGDLITPLHGEVHIYKSIEIQLGEYVTHLPFGKFGIIIETGISEWDVQYLKVLLPDGRVGWVREEKVEVLR